MRFKLFGTEIYISFLFAAVITAMLAFDRTGLMLPVIFASALHELGHLFAMWVCECEPKRIRLVPAAVEISAKIGKTHKNDIAVALSGPAVNLIIFFTLYFNYLAFKTEGTLVFALVNLLIGVFNLLPVTGLDGGSILLALLLGKTEENRAHLTVRIITFIFAALALAAGIFAAASHRFNPSFFIAAIYLAISAIIKR